MHSWSPLATVTQDECWPDEPLDLYADFTLTHQVRAATPMEPHDLCKCLLKRAAYFYVKQ